MLFQLNHLFLEFATQGWGSLKGGDLAPNLDTHPFLVQLARAV